MSNPVLDLPPASWQEGEARARRSASRRRLRRLALLAAGWVAMLAVWQLASDILSPTVLPSPARVGDEMWEIIGSGDFLEDFLASVGKTFAGFGVAAVVGAPVGYLMGRYAYWRGFFHDGVTVAGTIPALVYAVMSLIIFGLSDMGPILAVALVSAPYVAINVAEGIRGSTGRS
jgi:NitT/TauT family transport system permease protein